jgi:hypothetical protein
MKTHGASNSGSLRNADASTLLARAESVLCAQGSELGNLFSWRRTLSDTAKMLIRENRNCHLLPGYTNFIGRFDRQCADASFFVIAAELWSSRFSQPIELPMKCPAKIVYAGAFRKRSWKFEHPQSLDQGIISKRHLCWTDGLHLGVAIAQADRKQLQAELATRGVSCGATLEQLQCAFNEDPKATHLRKPKTEGFIWRQIDMHHRVCAAMEPFRTEAQVEILPITLIYEASGKSPQLRFFKNSLDIGPQASGVEYIEFNRGGIASQIGQAKDLIAKFLTDSSIQPYDLSGFGAGRTC